MTRPFRSLFFIFVLALCDAGVRHAQADGMAFPLVTDRKLPEIPKQRALLVWRNGEEQLTIESTFKGEGDRFGWVIPLPATPTRFAAATPGHLGALAKSTRPDIKVESDWGHPPYFSACFLLLWALIVYYHGGIRFRFILPGLILTVIGGIYLVSFLIHMDIVQHGDGWLVSVQEYHYGRTPDIGEGGSEDDVRSEKSERIGNYQVEVLQARTPQALNAWLERNGFAPLPAYGEKIVADLIRENWHFVAAKLISDDSGLFKPHPMSIAFPSIKLIYPMRLTALAGASVYLELYTIADREAVSPALTTEYCDTFKRAPLDFIQSYDSDHFHTALQQPEIFSQMWEDCTLTRLVAIMKPEEMKRDIIFDWKSTHPFQKVYYSSDGAFETTMCWMLAAWCVAVLEILFLAALMCGPALRTLLPNWLSRVFRKWRFTSPTGTAFCGAVILNGLFRQSAPTALIGYALALVPLLFMASCWKATRPRRRRFLGVALLVVTLATVAFGIAFYCSLPITQVFFEARRHY